MVKNIPAGNIHLSAAIYFSGASFAKMVRAFNALHTESNSSSTFYRYAQLYLVPTIISVWTDHRNKILESLLKRQGKIIFGGDVRVNKYHN